MEAFFAWSLDWRLVADCDLRLVRGYSFTKQIASILSFQDLATARGRETVFDEPEELFRCQDQPLRRHPNAPRGAGLIMVQKLQNPARDGFGSEKRHT